MTLEKSLKDCLEIKWNYRWICIQVVCNFCKPSTYLQTNIIVQYTYNKKQNKNRIIQFPNEVLLYWIKQIFMKNPSLVGWVISFRLVLPLFPAQPP
jgi:hypothetical protein